MAFPRRVDQQAVKQSQAMLLTDLPFVDAKTPDQAQFSASDSKTLLNDDSSRLQDLAFSVVDEELTDSFVERSGPSRLQRNSKRYVDQAHIAAENRDPESDQAHRETLGRQSKSRDRGYKSKVQLPASSLLTRTHAKLAPFAGLIVLVVMLSSAGMLFWILAGKGQGGIHLDELDQIEAGLSVQLDENEVNQAPFEISPQPEAAPIVSQVNPPQSEDLTEKLLEPDRSSNNPADVAGQTLPTPTNNTGQAIPLGEIRFPESNTPLAMDFGKAMAPASDTSPTEILDLPAVAEREVDHLGSPVAR